MTRCVIFDVDGTIFDTGEGIRYCARLALDELGARDFPDSKLNMFIGPSLFYSFNTIVGLDEETAMRGVELYRARYKTEGIEMSRPYGGMDKLLMRLKNDGFIITIASSKPISMVNYLLGKFDMAKYFEEVVAADFATVSSDKSDFIKKASKGDDNIMVGDTHFDIEGAHKAGVKVIAAAYGFGERSTLEGAEYIADSVEDVYTAVKKYFDK